jgi:beta-1,4-N-acetylglucosaminyltransferase
MILVTVGTTPFDELIRAVDESLPRETEVSLQIAEGAYQPKNFPWFKFTPAIGELYEKAELVICHAGAGTTYKLLEMRKKMVVVPNLTRSDPHQKELAAFVERGRHAPVCWDPAEIGRVVALVPGFPYEPFVKTPFQGGDLLAGIIRDAYPQGG